MEHVAVTEQALHAEHASETCAATTCALTNGVPGGHATSPGLMMHAENPGPVGSQTEPPSAVAWQYRTELADTWDRSTCTEPVHAPPWGGKGEVATSAGNVAVGPPAIGEHPVPWIATENHGCVQVVLVLPIRRERVPALQSGACVTLQEHRHAPTPNVGSLNPS